jgi:hypothetical protein
MRSLAILAAIFGVALLIGLTVYYGFDEVMAAIASSRWATALVVAARAAALVGAGIGWWALVPGRQWGPSAFVLLRFVREGINTFFHSRSSEATSSGHDSSCNLASLPTSPWLAFWSTSLFKLSA